MPQGARRRNEIRGQADPQGQNMSTPIIKYRGAPAAGARFFEVRLFEFAVAIAVLCGAPCSAAEYVAAGKFVIVINACKADKECEEIRMPTDVSSVLQCQRSIGASTIARWGEAHPAYTIKAWRCAAADEHDM
jgi:hypothetical protein